MRWALTISLLLLPMGAIARDLQGVVTKVEGNTAEFREAATDHILRLDRLTPEMVTRITAPEAKAGIFKISVPDEAISASTEKPYGIRGDCSELPFSIKDLEKLANDPKVKNIEDFLRAMPKGAMESYTFVTNSLSAQRGSGSTMVSEMWPRVLRGTMDGKVTFSYTCNPKSETYNHIEVFYFDDAEKKFKATSIKLNRPAGEGPSRRIHHNPTSCIECHSSGKKVNGEYSLKPNWQQYFFWGDCDRRRGITTYGMSDDNMAVNAYRDRMPEQMPKGCDSKKDLEAHVQQVADFEKFQKLQKDNPCYNLLPKPDPSKAGKSPWDYSAYPYTNEAQEMKDGFLNYSLRTNLRFTDTYSHLMSKRNYALIEKSADYEKVKYFLALEAAGCLKPEDDATINALLPDFEFSSASSDETPTDPRTSPLLYKFSQRAGMQDADWTMEFNVKNNPTYFSAMPRARPTGMFDIVRDGGIKDGVQGELLTSLAAENPQMASVLKGNITRGVEELFGKNFSCIDDLGGFLKAAGKSPERANGKESRMCQVFRAQNEAHLKKMGRLPASEPSMEELKVICKDQIDQALQPFADVISKIRDELLQKDTPLFRASVERGRKLVQHGKGQCIQCHSPTPENAGRRPASFLFIPAESMSKEEQAKALAIYQNRIKEGFLSEVSHQMETGNMPFVNSGKLTAEEQSDIMNYMKSLAVKPLQ